MVKNITDYGAFIDLGGIDGLLHITDMSWGRVDHPREMFKVGDEVDVIVLKFDPETERVSLGLQAAQCRIPWSTVAERVPGRRARVKGKVVSLTDYGAFIELEQGVEGLIHVSEMSWSKRVKHPSKILNVGDKVEAMVLGIDPKARRISLGLKQIEPNPWQRAGREVPGRLAHRRQGAQPDRVRRLRRGRGGHRRPGPHLRHVAGPSASSTRPRCSRRATRSRRSCSTSTPRTSACRSGSSSWRPTSGTSSSRSHQVGDTVEGKVVRLTNFGAFVELAEGIEGLVHVSEFDETQGGGEKIELKVGQTYPMKIIKLSPAERKIGLSIRALRLDQDRADWQTLRRRRQRRRDDRGALEELAVTRWRVSSAGTEGTPRATRPPIQRCSCRRSEAVIPGGSMTKAELVEEVSRVSDLTKKHSEVIVDTVFWSIIDALQRGEKIELRGFGSFRLRRREPRKGRNPKTGEGWTCRRRRCRTSSRARNSRS